MIFFDEMHLHCYSTIEFVTIFLFAQKTLDAIFSTYLSFGVMVCKNSLFIMQIVSPCLQKHYRGYVLTSLGFWLCIKQYYNSRSTHYKVCFGNSFSMFRMHQIVYLFQLLSNKLHGQKVFAIDINMLVRANSQTYIFVKGKKEPLF